MASITSFNSIGGFGVGDNKTLVIDSNANVVANSIVSTGDISATGNIVTAGYFQGDGSLLTGVAPTVQVFEFANVVSTGGYYEATWLGDYVPGNVANVTVTVADTPTLMGGFITDVGYPYVDVVPTGTILVRVESIKLSGSRSYTMYAQIYARTEAGTETLVATSDATTPTVDNTLVQQSMIAYIATPVSINKTDRIVVKVYATLSQGTVDIALNFDNNTGSGLQLPALPATISTFVPYTGATANIDLNSKSLTSNANITANKFIGNGALLTNINASNINGQVANALVAGTVYTADQPSITSVGILTSLTVSGAITAASVGSTGNVSGGNLRTGGVVSAAGNVTGGNFRTTGLVSATGNITGNVFVGNGAALTSVIPSEQINWNTWMNGSNLANCTASGTPLTTSGYAGYAVHSGITGYGYELTNNSGGASGSLFWSIPDINWSSNNPITFKASVAATSPTQTGGSAGDGPTIYVGGSTYATIAGVANAGLGVTVCYYTGTPRVQLYNGSTLLASFTSTSPDFTLNSSTLYQYGTTSLSTNWYDLELVLKKFGSKRIAEVKINGSMVAQYDVTSWSPVGSYVSVAAQCGAAYSYQFCRAFSASW